MIKLDNISIKRECRFCKNQLHVSFLNLGNQPLCQEHISPINLNKMEPYYPLHAMVCDNCFLVQVEEFVKPSDIFSDYSYFSSFSDSWVEHAKKYVHDISKKMKLNKHSFVAEIASNDGYLLQWFKEKEIPILGIEPADNVAEYAINEKNIPTEIVFFGVETALKLKEKYGQPDLIIGNNVLAHVPDINDFVQGLKCFLDPNGIITLEFPHLKSLMENNQFDTIYHEHFSYLSLLTCQKIFKTHGLEIWDVEEINTHGGSLRIYAKHIEDKSKIVSDTIHSLIRKEIEFGLDNILSYEFFRNKVEETKRNILEFLINAKGNKKTIVGYGAPGKGNTLLNYCGIKTDFIDFTVDRNPKKQNNYLPGSLIPIYSVDKIKEVRPDYVFVLPWNLIDEIKQQHEYIQEWGGKFVIPIPEITILN